jgi:hypothetical protein
MGPRASIAYVMAPRRHQMADHSGGPGVVADHRLTLDRLHQ